MKCNMKNETKKINVLMCCSHLSVKGGMVSVVKNYLGYENWDNINIIYIPTHIEKSKVLVLIYFALAYMRVLWLFLTKKIEIAHLHTAERGSFYRKAFLVRICKKFGVKTVMHHHAAEFELFYEKLSEKQKKYINKTLAETDVNLVLSERLVPMIKSKCPGANVKVLYNAVNTYEQNPYNSKATGVLFLGRLGERKGTYDLLQVIKTLDKNIKQEIKFYLCGDGDIGGVSAKVDQLGIRDRIAHLGWIDAKEKKEIFFNSKINVLPSYNEGLPMSILETMAYGIPNLSTKIASIPEVIKDGKNGFLINPGDIEDMANKLNIMLNDNELMINFSNESYLLITDKFSLSTHIKIIKVIYKELLL